jgi:hypothetical protein
MFLTIRLILFIDIVEEFLWLLFSLNLYIKYIKHKSKSQKRGQTTKYINENKDYLFLFSFNAKWNIACFTSPTMPNRFSSKKNGLVLAWVDGSS